MYSIIGGIASIVITIVLYLAILGDSFLEAMCLITLFGVVLAEGVAACLFYMSKGDPRKLTAAISAAVMVPIAVILSLVYIVNFPEGYLTYFAFYIVAFIALLTVGSFLWNFSNKRKQEDDVVQSAKANMLEMRKLVKCVMVKPGAQKFKKELTALEEKLHFSNDCVVTEKDAEIRQMLIILDDNIDNAQFDAADYIKSIAAEIDRRNIFSKNTI